LKVSGILKKSANERTSEELEILAKSPELTDRLQKLANKRDAAKSRHLEVTSNFYVKNTMCKLETNVLQCY
jgi:predicted transcriptional regulator